MHRGVARDVTGHMTKRRRPSWRAAVGDVAAMVVALLGATSGEAEIKGLLSFWFPRWLPTKVKKPENCPRSAV